MTNWNIKWKNSGHFFELPRNFLQQSYALKMVYFLYGNLIVITVIAQKTSTFTCTQKKRRKVYFQKCSR